MTFPHQSFAPRANAEKLLVISREGNILWVFLKWRLWPFLAPVQWLYGTAVSVKQFFSRSQ